MVADMGSSRDQRGMLSETGLLEQYWLFWDCDCHYAFHGDFCFASVALGSNQLYLGIYTYTFLTID
jgi:hypothetical protein